MKVFVAEDYLLLRSLLVKTISKLKDIEVVGQAGSFDEAKLGVEQTRPQAVVLDLNLPGGRGLELIKLFKSMDSSLKIIVFTGFAFEKMRLECVREGADYFLDKLADYKELFRILNELNKNFGNRKNKVSI